ncbi:SRPBCC domain-containing protein [Oceanobacillus sp. ISL-73]|uniref:SRPBCC domain-containing protein n=1 Tax=Oceanobacillus sp. ISL-73 TaxID=2819161 RepID=UPI001BE76B0F|nr:SRPBCC domain-containing protein [Oceanobacillus sp. ISL-73]MBT2652911.1 SRPBCC domain-containing protein [Oceanobacillus sp. ISL-73]
MNPKINIVTIPVENLDLSTRFYREVFALPEDKISSGDDHVAFFLEGEMSLVLYERSGFVQTTEQHEDNLNTSSVIFSHTAKGTKEVNSILSSALKAGGKVTKEGTADEWGYTGLFKDIDGYTWEVMSWLEMDDTYTIEVNREYKYKPEILFKAWTSPQILKNLFGLTEIEMDVRVGGSFRFTTDQVEALPGMHTESGEYKVIEPNKRIEKSWNYEGPMSPDKTLNSEITLEFTEIQPNVTKVILRENSSFLSNVDMRNQARDKWTHALIEIDDLLK